MSEIICPQCGTEVTYASFKNQDTPQCKICGKILLAEAMKVKQKLLNNRDGSILELTPKSKTEDSRRMGKKLQQLGDDDLFGDLEPFDLEDGEANIDEDFSFETEGSKEVQTTTSAPSSPKKPKTPSSSQNNIDKDNEEVDDSTPVFKNPMEKSNLIKKLKDDHDLFESLDS